MNMVESGNHGSVPGGGVDAASGFGARGAAEPLGEVVWRWVMRGSVVAVALSLMIHLVSLAILGVISMPYGLSGGRPGPVGDIDVAIVSEGELDQLQAGASEAAAPTVPEMVGADPAVQDLMSPEAGEEAGSSFGEVSDVGTISGGGDIGGVGGSLGGGGGGGGGSGASFFGVEARGNRFAFIVDVSGSMGDGEKMPSLKRELAASVMGMRDVAQFLVVPFSDREYPLGGVTKWRDSTQTSKKWAKQLIDALQPMGGTAPASSFDLVLNMRPRPDAVYFMTDGLFDQSVVTLIEEMSKTVKVPIHCMCITSRESEEAMKKIAKDSGGTYHFIP
jgi:hypothetical protein